MPQFCKPMGIRLSAEHKRKLRDYRKVLGLRSNSAVIRLLVDAAEEKDLLVMEGDEGGSYKSFVVLGRKILGEN